MRLCWKIMGTKEDQQKAQHPLSVCLHKESLQRKYSWSHRNEEWQLEEVNILHFRGNYFFYLFKQMYFLLYLKPHISKRCPVTVLGHFRFHFHGLEIFQINLQRFVWRSSFFFFSFNYRFIFFGTWTQTHAGNVRLTGQGDREISHLRIRRNSRYLNYGIFPLFLPTQARWFYILRRFF